MLNLSPAQILEVWESGARRHPLDRALLLLHRMQPDMVLPDLADLSIGQRDQLLLTLRRQLFGRELPGYIDCPVCRTRLEFMLDTEAFRSTVNDHPVEVDGLCVRPPTSRDLASVMKESDPEQAAYRLAQRCCAAVAVESAHELPVLSTAQAAKIESILAEIDTAADSVLDFSCTHCHHTWQTPFDIGDYLWREIERYAGKLMHDIHTLALAYGWNEHDILELSDVRRAAYIDRVLA